MTKEEFLDKLSIDGRIVPKRCADSYLSKNGLTKELDLLVPTFSGTTSERILHLRTGGGYCETCGCRVPRNSDGKSFNRFCLTHAHDGKRGKPAHNKKDISIEKAIEMYESGKSILEISTEFDISNVALAKRFEEAGYTLRSHSENQKLQSYKWKDRVAERYSYINQELLNDVEWILEQNKTKTVVQIAKELNCSESAVQAKIRSVGEYAVPHNHSKEETFVDTILKSTGISYQVNCRNIIAPKEIDFWVPSASLGIEVNGLYWHSELRSKDKDYHWDKHRRCLERGIELIQFWDYEINQTPEKVKSLIISKLGLSRRIYARQCVVDLNIPKEEERAFFETNHRQGWVSSTCRVGLRDKDGSLVAMMSFGPSRYNKSFEVELLRYASSLGINVVGGAARCMSQLHFKSIISYSNNRYGSGKMYSSLGFKRKSEGKPTYSYTLYYSGVQSRLKFQKHKLKNVLKQFDPALSEWDNMKANGYDRVWDCGQSVWVLER